MTPVLPTVHIAVHDTLADWETGYLAAALTHADLHRDAGYRVQHVGADPGPVTSMGGLRILPDLTLDDLAPTDSAMLVLPGSQVWFTDAYLPYVAKARQFLEAGTPVAAICGATGALAAAGLLDDRRHTSNAAEFLASTGYAGAHHYVDQPAVVDGDLVTASGVAPVEFAYAVLSRLDAWRPDVLDSWFKLYRHQDPQGFHELMAASS